MEQFPHHIATAAALLHDLGEWWSSSAWPWLCDWWWDEHAIHSHLTFVEVSFGLNTVFALYEDLRKYIRSNTEREIESMREALRATVSDSKPEDALFRVVTMTRRKVEREVTASDTWQEQLSNKATRIAIIFAVAAAAILYFNLVGVVSWGCIILILPLPVYWIRSWSNYGGCLKQCQNHMNTFNSLKDEFLEPDLPA